MEVADQRLAKALEAGGCRCLKELSLGWSGVTVKTQNPRSKEVLQTPAEERKGCCE